MDTTKPRDPEPNETLDAYLQAHGVEHFSAREILTLRRAGVTVDAPPRPWWPRIIPTLELAEMLRAEVGHPLIVGNGYRPNPWNRKVGGARRSPHLFFRALDLDLPRGHKSREDQERFYEAAGSIFLDHGERYKMGLGLYRLNRGTRVHIDAGHRRRSWSRKYVKPLLNSLR